MKRIRFFVKYVTPFLLVVITCGFFLSRAELFTLQKVPFEISFPESHEYLANSYQEYLTANLKIFEGRNVWGINLSKMYKQINKEPWVKKLKIRRSFPNQLKIDIETQEVLAVIKDKGSRFIPLMANGQLLSPVVIGMLPDVPIFSVNSRAKLQDEGKKVAKLMKELNRSSEFSPANIETLAWNSEKGLILQLLKPSVELVFGETDIAKRQARVLKVLRYLDTQKQQARVIDARFSKKVLVRLRKDS